MDPQFLQAILAHARLDRTLDEYTQVELDDVKRQFARLDPFNDYGNGASSPTEARELLERLSVLAAGGLEWETIKEECLAQESGRNWASHLVAKLEQLEDQHDVRAPIEGEPREWAQVQAMGAVVSRFLRGSSSSFEMIHKHLRKQYGFTQQDTEAELSRLVKYRVLRVEKRGTRQLYREA